MELDDLVVSNYLKISEEQFAKELCLEVVYNPKKGIIFTTVNVNRPGVMLAGYKTDFAEKRVQVLGRTEMGFLESNNFFIDSFFECEIPCVIITAGIEPTKEILQAAKKYERSIFTSTKNTPQLIEDVAMYLNDRMAPSQAMHGVLMDVYGTGVLLEGESSIGKSETALELIYRGHRLVADDSVILKRINDHIYGTSPEIIQHFMEIRGVGIIDVKAIYGEGSVIDKKRVEIIIKLEKWDNQKVYERIGNVQKYELIMGVKIPILLIPVDAGRNLAVVIEVATRDYRLKQAGHKPYEIVQKRMDKDK